VTIVVGLLLFLIALLGAPLFAIIASSALFSYYQNDIDLTAIAIEIFRIADSPVLISIPMFTFAGYLLSESNASQRLAKLTQTLFGWMPAGLAVVTIMACAFFTGLTGASGMTIIAIGALLYPALRQMNYSDRFSLGLVTTSGSLGLLFPPSVALILYGIVAQQMDLGTPVSIDQMFLAGLLPGALMLALLTAWSMWATRNFDIPKADFSRSEAMAAVKDAIWEIPFPIVVLGGIYSGFFAISEAAAVSVAYALLVEVFIKKEIRFKDLFHITRDAMVLVGGIMLILAVSLASTNALIDAEVPSRLFDFIQRHVDSTLTFLILLNIFLLALGMILDIFSAIVIVVPLILPVAVKYGIHPVHLGIIFLANMQVGYSTPPIGMNLFIASYRFKKPITELYRASVPFILVLLLSVLIITYWPGLSLALL
jgi:tripartite ATP-independent transporter DctM subunit